MLKYLLLIGSLLFFRAVLSQHHNADDNRHSMDSVQQHLRTKLDSLSRINLSTPENDSLKQAWQSQLDKLDKLSLSNHRLDSLQRHYQSRIDSLKALDLPHEKYLTALDSITSLPNEKISEKMTAWQEQGKEKLQSWKNDISEKTDVSVPDVHEEIPLEEMDLAGVETSAITEKVTMKELDTGLALPDELVDTGELKEELKLDKVQQEVAEIQDMPIAELEKAKEAVHMDDISGELDKVSELSSEGERYAEEAQAVKEGDFTSVEEKAGQEMSNNFDEIAGLEEHKGALEQARQEHEEYLELQREYLVQAKQYNDPEFVKQRIMEKSKYVANQKLVEYKSQVENAQKELLNLKMDTLRSLADIPDATEWPLKDRMILGTNLEVSRDEVTRLDLAPYIGFMLNDRWHIYGGYMYRIRFNNDKTRLQTDSPVYGPRLATTYRFFKGFYVRFSGEQIRANVPVSGKGDESTREWVYGAYAGIGNRYNIARHVKGTVQLMYNFLHDAESPYTRTFNIRMGFEVDLKKRTTRKDVIREMEKRGKRQRVLNALKK